MIKISFRNIIVVTPIIIVLTFCVWSWVTPMYDGTLLGKDMTFRGLVRVISWLVIGGAGFVGAVVGGIELWDKNPTLTIGRKKSNLTKARVVKRK